MKVSYDQNGKILAVAIDSKNLSGNILQVEDSQDLLLRPNKYEVVNGSVVRRRYLELITDATDSNNNGIPDVPADGNTVITITVKSYLGTGEFDSSGNDIINISPVEGVIISSYQLNLVNGEASFMIKSNLPGIKNIFISCDTAYCEPLKVEFV